MPNEITSKKYPYAKRVVVILYLITVCAGILFNHLVASVTGLVIIVVISLIMAGVITRVIIYGDPHTTK